MADIGRSEEEKGKERFMIVGKSQERELRLLLYILLKGSTPGGPYPQGQSLSGKCAETDGKRVSSNNVIVAHWAMLSD